MNRLTTQTAGGARVFRGTLNETASVTVATAPATVTSGNQFTGRAPVGTGTTSVAIKATDPTGNLRTNTYQVSQSGATKSFTYDPNGNLTGDGTKTYIWDRADRLVEVKQGATSLAAFNYNGRGLRGNKIVGAASVTYIYEGNQVIEDRPSAGSTTRYVYGPGIDRPLAQVIGGTTTYNVADHLGSVVRRTDSGGNPTLTREYDPWGNPLQGAAASGYAFTGRDWDAETGLYYYRARYYSAPLGRFPSQDPVLAPNRYSYADNAPQLKTDPSGLVSVSVPQPMLHVVTWQEAADNCAGRAGCNRYNPYIRWKCVASGTCVYPQFSVGSDRWDIYVAVNANVAPDVTFRHESRHKRITLAWIYEVAAAAEPEERKGYSNFGACDEAARSFATRWRDILEGRNNQWDWWAWFQGPFH